MLPSAPDSNDGCANAYNAPPPRARTSLIEMYEESRRSQMPPSASVRRSTIAKPTLMDGPLIQMARELPSVTAVSTTRLSRPILVPSEFDFDVKTVGRKDESSGSISALDSVHPRSALSGSTKISSRDSLLSFTDSQN